MITGEVKSDEARIRLKVKRRRGREQKVEAVIDSGDRAVTIGKRASSYFAECAR